MRSFRGMARALLVLVVFNPLWTHASEATPGQTWGRLPTPETAGWSASKLGIADRYARELGTDAYLIVDRGMLVHEYGNTSRATNVHSMRKSILSLLFGIHADRGEIALNKTMVELGINDRQPLTDAEKQATIRQLMQARSGIYHAAAYETLSMDARRPARGSHAPGTYFYYNNWDFNALGTIFHKLSNKTVFEALRDELALPMQFENFNYTFDTRFHYEPASEHPAYLIRLSARDLARIGLLVARNGRWGERQLVPENWLAESLQSYSQTSNAGLGYGYLWWVGLNGRHFDNDFPGGVVSARGHNGQYVVVDLARGIIVVHKVDTELKARRSVSAKEFGQLLKLILDART